MTREHAKELLPVIKAYSEGKKIEFRTFNEVSGGPWTLAVNPGFNSSCEWRVKPEPREFFVNIYPDHDCYGMAFETRRNADSYAGPTRVKCIKVREVLD